MSNQVGFYSNLTNGVSQQPYRVRLESQVDAAENLHITTFQQVGPRPPLEIVSELASLDAWLDIETNGYPFNYGYTRDDEESYEIIFDGDGGLKVFDRATGAEKTVTFASGTAAYLTHSAPETGFACLTYKDTTFVVNRSITVAMAGGLSTSRNTEALIRVKDWVTGATYSVSVKIGASTFTVTPTGSTVNAVATDIKTKLEALGGWPGTTTTTVYSNVVHIIDSADGLTNIDVGDNRAGTAIAGFIGKVLKTGDLPPYAPNGYIVQVTGSESSTAAEDANTSDDQYYTFEADNGTGGSGRWVETVAPGIKYAIDATTAPHTLTRQAGGTFNFDPITWGERGVGDEATNPTPLFVGQKIENIMLNGNRLGFIAGNSWHFSRVGEESWYAMFRSTTATLLDDDPVYGFVPSQQVNKIYHGIAWNSELVFLGDRADGIVSYGNKFSLSDISISTPTVTGVSPVVGPLLSGSDLLYITEDGDFSNIGAYQIDPVTSLRDADSITTDYLGRYIPKNVTRFVGREKDFAAVFSTETRNQLYILTYTKKAGRLIQRAVSRWGFGNIPGMDILTIRMDESYLYVTYRGPDSKVYVGRMDTSAGASDAGWPYKCYLDHRQAQSYDTYNSDTNQTTFTLDYALTGAGKRACIGTADPTDEIFAVGETLTIASSTATTLVFDGDLTDGSLSIYSGYSIDRTMDISPIHARTANPNTNQRVANLLADLNVQRVAVGFFNTQYLKVAVIATLDGREISVREYTGGLHLDNGYSRLDDNTATFTGKLLLATEGIRPEEGYLRLSSDSVRPFFVDSIQWLANEFTEAL